MRRERAGLSRSACGSAGFTVAEFVAAAGILFVVLTGVLGAVEYAGASTRMTAIRQDAVAIATQQVEKARNMPYDDLGVVYADGSTGNPEGTIPAVQTISTIRATFKVTTTVGWNFVGTGSSMKSTYKKYRVTVAWTEPAPGGSVSLDTAIYGQGTTTANSGVTKITIVDVEDEGIRIQGGTIKLTVPGFNQKATSDENGECMWGGVPVTVPGSLVASATYTDNSYLIAAGTVNGSAIGSGLNDLGIVYAQKPRAVQVTVKSASDALVPNATVTLKDKVSGEQFVLTTDSQGVAAFNATSLGRPGLWFSTYRVSATASGYGSLSEEFALSEGGPLLHEVTLVLPDPTGLVVTIKASSTNDPITGKSMIVKVWDPEGTLLPGSGGTFTTSAPFSLTTTGTYTISVTGVSGFVDNTAYTFFTGLGTDVTVAVPLDPLFQVYVKRSSAAVGIAGARVTLANASTGVVVSPMSGSSPAITGSDGLASYAIPATANYNVSALVNGVTYTGTPNPVPLSVGSPPTSQYVISVPMNGALSVNVVKKNTSGWKRYVCVYDIYDNLVGEQYATRTANVPVFTGLYPGRYKVVICGTGISNDPVPVPSASSGSYTVNWLTAPGVVSGSTYAAGPWSAPN